MGDFSTMYYFLATDPQSRKMLKRSRNCHREKNGGGPSINGVPYTNDDKKK